METSNELKEFDIKNRSCYYFDHIININYLELDNVLVDKKSCNNLLYCIQNSVCCKAFTFEKVDGYIRKYDETKDIASFRSNEKYERIFIKSDILLC